MKRIIILSIGLIGLFASCKKSSSTPTSASTPIPSGMRATINGIKKVFTNVPIASKDFFSSSVFEIEIDGSMANGETIELSLSNILDGGVDSVYAGAYSDTSSKFKNSIYYLTEYNTTDPPYNGGTAIDGFQHPAAVPNHFTITITSITDNSVEGTFSGNVYPTLDATGTPLSIVDGSFNVPMRII